MKARALLLAFAAAGPALAASDADLQRCRALPEAAARLACYDALPLGGPPAAAAAPAPAAPASPPPASFGFEQKAAAAGPEMIESRISGAFEGWGAHTLFRLDNGQVWQVSDDSRAVMDLRDPKVRVVRGSFGSFFLEVEGRNQRARVKRVE